jgi:phage shock protein A
MNLLSRISVAIRATANDLLNPRQSPGDPAAESARLLKSAQQRADRLKDTLALSETREKLAEQAWRNARAQAEALEAEANAAVRAGQDDIARTKLAQLNQAQNKVMQLSDGWKICAATSEKLRIEIKDLQTQLAAIRQRLGQGAPPPTTAQAAQRLSQPGLSSQAAARPAASVNTLKQDETPAANAGGQAADKNLDQTRIADLLKKRDER